MKSAFTYLTATISAIILFLTGCDRQNSAKKEEGSRIQPGGINEESEQWGYLALKIAKVHENQKALDASPWFAAGGDWTFLECEAEKEPTAHILIGTRMRSAPKGDVPISWGEAMIARTEPERNSQLFVTSTAEPTKRTLLTEFEGSVLVQEHVPAAQGTTMLVTEMLHQKAKTISSLDPQRLWLVDGMGKHELSGPPGVTNWFASKRCLSPDARFVTLGSWETRLNQKRARVIHLADLQTGKWRKIALPATLLELVGWFGEKPTGLVLAGRGVKRNEVRKAYSLEPITAQLTPLDEIPREFTPARNFSPDGKRFIEVIGKERFVITDATTDRQREFTFHPYDRRNVFPDSVHWGDNRYLVFQSARSSLIDADTLKMNYPTAKESGIDSVEFSPDFKLALGLKSDGHYLGSVVLSNRPNDKN